MNSFSKALTILIAFGGLSTGTTAVGGVIGINSADLGADSTFDFNDLDLCGLLKGCAIDTLLDLDGFTIGERFAGQTLGTTSTIFSTHDTLTQDPTGPLSLLAGATSRNLYLTQDDYIDGWAIGGLGIDGISIRGLGEGAVSILFDTDLSGFGLSVVGGDNSGSVIFDFFARDGSLLNRILRGGGSGEPITFAFASETGVNEIAGVSITNIELNGVFFDDFALRTSGVKPPDDEVSVPEPGTLALLGIGLAALGLSRRRKYF